ncbi:MULTISPECIES: hypothetical protein [unclassified Luteibacter]|uniref:hypothetical protein n=1 Tax=Luteibacter sp. PvP019 TaxID=3156436 RepID=UPI0033953018
MTSQRAIDYVKLRDTRSILNAVEADLRGVPNSDDARSLPRLALLLALTIQPLSDDAKAALDAAAAYLDHGIAASADTWINAWASRIDESATSMAIAATDRLVWIALNRNSVFSDYGVEFTLEAAANAGIDIAQIAAAVAIVMNSQGASGTLADCFSLSSG